jgi:glucokinase
MSTTARIGVDIGGTNVKIVKFEENTWKILEEKTISTEAEKGFMNMFDRVCEEVTGMRNNNEVIGLCVPGPVKQPDGILLRAPNIEESENIDLKKLLKKKFQVDVPVENDGHCFALAEAVKGTGKGLSIVCGVTIGTGVGGGLIINEKIFSGAHGFAGELGHLLLRPGNPPYKTTDMRGDAEQFLSGTAFHERCKAAKDPSEFLDGETCAFLYPEIFMELAWLCTNITHAYDPSMIVFGGSTGKALKPHIKSIEAELKKWLLPSTPVPRLAVSVLEHPGALGAALLTL